MFFVFVLSVDCIFSLEYRWLLQTLSERLHACMCKYHIFPAVAAHSCISERQLFCKNGGPSHRRNREPGIYVRDLHRKEAAIGTMHYRPLRYMNWAMLDLGVLQLRECEPQPDVGFVTFVSDERADTVPALYPISIL